MKRFRLGDREIGGESPCFIIAEISANHGGSLDKALEAIRAAAGAGADAVKVQTFRADGVTIDSDKNYFRIDSGTSWDGQNLFRLYQQAEMPWEWQPELKKEADSLGLVFLSTATNKESTDFIEEMGCPGFKIASFEITDHELIRYVASKGKPVLFSKGIATIQEIQEAIAICQSEGNHHIALLQCTSSYPAPLNEANLRIIPNLADTFDVVPGLSDHTLGILAPIIAVSMGARIIEKHFIADKSLDSPDADFSMDPREFQELVTAVRDTEKALGKVDYELSERSVRSRGFARSLFVVADIEEGESFTAENVRAIRPGDGLHPRHLTEVLGRRARFRIERGEPFRWVMIDE